MSRPIWLVLASHVPGTGALGGMIRYTVEVTRSLELRDDVEVHVHCQPETESFLAEQLGIDRARIHPTASGSVVLNSLAERMTIGRLGQSIDADVIFGSKQLMARPGRDGAVRLLTVHDMLPFDRPRDFGLTKRLLLPTAYRQSIQSSDVIACVSDAARDRLVHHVPSVADRSVVIPNAMTSLLGRVRPEPIDELRGRRFALIVGDRSQRKNMGFIVGLWPEITARVADAHLALVGPPGWGRNEQLPDLAPLVEAGMVSELGRVDDGRLRWAYKNAAVTLCPSLLEGFGLPVLEALTLGCPAIISTDPAQVEAGAGQATAIDVGDARSWVDAIVDHLSGARRPVVQPASRTWDDVAAELLVAVDAFTTARRRV